ncbi:MAG TPA: FecR domain-containing protein [Thermoanaerobaculia bacterium]|jgi:hypothetical protein
MTTRLSASLLTLFLAATPVLAADVGEVVLARNVVRGTPPNGVAKALAAGDGLGLGLRVETGVDSTARMTFDPSGSLTLGARAKVTLDAALVDQVTGRSESALSVLAGAVRLALGKLFHGDVSIDTPTAVVGVKGTDLRVEVDEATGATVVTVTEGVVTVRSKAGGQVTVRAGQRTLVVAGRAPDLPSPLDPGSGALSASAGGPAFTPPQAAFPETPLAGLGGQIVVRPARPNG